MSSTAKSGTRAYESPLRKDQAEATRARLVEAVLAEAKASGTGDVSMLAVARRAQVAPPTVYRHFPTRKEMLAALHAHVLALVPPPEATGDLGVDVRAFYRWRGAMQDAIGPFAAGPLVWDMRREITVPMRRARFEEIVDREVPGLAEPARTKLVDLLIVIVSDTEVAAFRGYLGIDVDAAADRALWAIEALLDRARGEAAKAKSGKAGRAVATGATTRTKERAGRGR